MSEPKPFASLSSGLLARKGAAKPAMRPQGYAHTGPVDDLGWNDMGHGPEAAEDFPEGAMPEHVPSSIAALTPAPGARAQPVPAPPEEPVVVEQQRALEEHFEAKPAEVVQLPRRHARPAGSRPKAAFTLRLDPDRHLKLRLACTLTRRSAQQIVTEALDELLNSLPQVEALARQVPDSGTRAG